MRLQIAHLSKCIRSEKRKNKSSICELVIEKSLLKKFWNELYCQANVVEDQPTILHPLSIFLSDKVWQMKITYFIQNNGDWNEKQ